MDAAHPVSGSDSWQASVFYRYRITVTPGDCFSISYKRGEKFRADLLLGGVK